MGTEAWPIARRTQGDLADTILADLEAAWMEHGDAFRLPIGDVMMPVFAGPSAVQHVLTLHRGQDDDRGATDDSAIGRAFERASAQCAHDLQGLEQRARGSLVEVDMHKEMSALAAHVVQSMLAGTPAAPGVQLLDVYEAIASSLPWLFAFLDERPDVLAAMQGEVRHVLGARRFERADADRLTYVQQVIDETLRLRAPSAFVTRKAVRNDVVDGYRINAGETVLLFVAAARRHPAHWPDAEVFRPERLGDGNAQARAALAATRGDGCLASLVMTAALVALLERFEMLTVPRRVSAAAPIALLRPAPAVRVVLRSANAPPQRHLHC